MARVHPRCEIGAIEPYISADGTYYPCCWIGNIPTCFQLREYLGPELWAQLDIKHNDLTEIEASVALAKLKASWLDGDFQPCVYICGRPYDPSESTSKDMHVNASLASDELTID